MFRSGLWPPSKTFSILCNASFCSSIQSCTTGGLTGVPKSLTASAICRGERSVHSTSGSSGSPAVRTSRTDFRFRSSSGSDSTLFFDRHPDAARVPRQGPQAIGPVRPSRARWSVSNTPRPWPHTRSHRGPVDSLPARRTVADPFPTTSARTPASASHARLIALLKYESHPWPPWGQRHPCFREHRRILPYHRKPPTVVDSRILVRFRTCRRSFAAVYAVRRLA